MIGPMGRVKLDYQISLLNQHTKLMAQEVIPKYYMYLAPEIFNGSGQSF
jgi:hypothetical protein